MHAEQGRGLENRKRGALSHGGGRTLAVLRPAVATGDEEMAAVGALPPGSHFPRDQRSAERYATQTAVTLSRMGRLRLSPGQPGRVAVYVHG